MIRGLRFHALGARRALTIACHGSRVADERPRRAVPPAFTLGCACRGTEVSTRARGATAHARRVGAWATRDRGRLGLRRSVYAGALVGDVCCAIQSWASARTTGKEEHSQAKKPASVPKCALALADVRRHHSPKNGASPPDLRPVRVFMSAHSPRHRAKPQAYRFDRRRHQRHRGRRNKGFEISHVP